MEASRCRVELQKSREQEFSTNVNTLSSENERLNTKILVCLTRFISCVSFLRPVVHLGHECFLFFITTLVISFVLKDFPYKDQIEELFTVVFAFYVIPTHDIFNFLVNFNFLTATY